MKRCLMKGRGKSFLHAAPVRRSKNVIYSLYKIRGRSKLGILRRNRVGGFMEPGLVNTDADVAVQVLLETTEP